MQRSKALYKHILTGEIYAIEIDWGGTLIGSCGPIGEFGNIDYYKIESENNDWIQENNEDLILI